jgi:hypothetical protein
MLNKRETTEQRDQRGKASGKGDTALVYKCSHRQLTSRLIPVISGESVIRNKRKTVVRLSIIASLIVCWLCPAGAAQQNPPGALPDAPSSSAQSPQATKRNNPIQGGTALVQVLERKSLVFPDLATTKGTLSPWDKFKLAANNSVAVSTIGAALVGAAYGQAVDSPEGYGQGGEGYAKRFGANMARAASDNMFGTFLIASVMHEDPRFYVKKGLSFRQSVEYAAVRVVKTRSDDGQPVTNFAGLLGPLAGEALANTYYPEGSRGVGDTFIRYSADLGWRFAGNLLKQYWPAINKKLRLTPAAPEPNPNRK